MVSPQLGCLGLGLLLDLVELCLELCIQVHLPLTRSSLHVLFQLILCCCQQTRQLNKLSGNIEKHKCEYAWKHIDGREEDASQMWCAWRQQIHHP